MEQKVLSAIQHHSMISGEKEVTVALSGGADSMALLCVLLALREQLGITVSAAHLHHGIRGEEADRDEAFVRAQCAMRQVPLTVERIHVPAIAKERRLGLEAAAREVRYAFLERVSPGLIATAHTASDHLETVLLHLARGAGLTGLGGIAPKRGRLIRPLITCTRDEVEQYCEKNGIAYITDSTNLSDEYSRNKLRHRVVPILKELNPAAETAALRASLTLREDAALLEELSEGEYRRRVSGNVFSLKDIASCPAAIAKRAIKRFLESRQPGLFLDHEHLEQVYQICLHGGRTGLPKAVRAVSAGGLLYLEPPKDDRRTLTVTIERAKIRSENGEKIHNLLLKNTLDCDRIDGNLEIRTRLPGDQMRLAGSGYTKTLKKIFNELHIPLYERECLPVIADNAGVVWVYGVGVAARCAVSEKTENVFIIHAQEAQNSID